MAKIVNRDAAQYVNRQEPFYGSNIFAFWTGSNRRSAGVGEPRYVVCSYGHHFPMYIWEQNTEQWFGNSDKYSVTTTRHQSQCRPTTNSIVWLPTRFMLTLAEFGFRQLVVARMEGEMGWQTILRQHLDRPLQGGRG